MTRLFETVRVGFRIAAVAWLIACLSSASVSAKVERVEILNQTAFAGGRSFGDVGPYEKVTGRLHYAVDPGDPQNRLIVDLKRAPTDQRGMVLFAGDFILLRPADPTRGNRTLLYDVNNRGSLVALGYLNDAPWSNDPSDAADAGNGFLFEEGYAILWSGWNWDVLPGNGRLQIDVPIAYDNGKPITGLIANEIVVNQAVPAAPVVWGRSRGYSPVDLEDPSSRLTVRNAPAAERRPIARQDWRFLQPRADTVIPVAIELQGGLQPGLIYELTYLAKDPRVVGLGLTAIRDTISHFRFDETDSRRIESTIIFGVSQSGRVIQHMLWQGLHLDEAGRQVFDAALIHVAGGGKGSFNHRFAQTTRHQSAWEDHLYPADVFPFTTTAQSDPISGGRGSVLDRARAAGAVPHLIYTQTSTEYWTRSASLLHTDVNGERDLPLDPRARLYVFAGAKHGNWIRTGRDGFSPMRQSARSPTGPTRDFEGAAGLDGRWDRTAGQHISETLRRHIG